MLNVAVLGCGKIAQVRHIPEYAANEHVCLVGFFNPTASRAEDMAQKYGGKVYSSPEELLADPKVDAVSVCSATMLMLLLLLPLWMPASMFYVRSRWLPQKLIVKQCWQLQKKRANVF